MTVAIGDNERRVSAPARGLSLEGLSLGGLALRSRRTTLAVALGSLGLVAFTYGAFSFFGELADPRARMPRPRAASVAMPDFKDGVPAPVPTRTAAPAPAAAEMTRAPVVPAVAAEPFVPGFAASEPAARPAAPAVVASRPEATSIPEQRAGEATGSVARTGPAKSVVSESAAAKPLPQIENAAAVQAAPRQAAVIAPLRLSNPLPPGKVETVRAKPVAKPVEETNTAPAPVIRAAVAKAPEPVQAETAKRASAAKPPRERPVRAASADNAPTPRASAPRREAAEESDDLGSKVTKGIKAIGGIFSSDD